MRRSLCLIAVAALLSAALGCSCKQWRKQNETLKVNLTDQKGMVRGLEQDLEGKAEQVLSLSAELESAGERERKLAALLDERNQEQSDREERMLELEDLVETIGGIDFVPGPDGNFLKIESEMLFDSGKIELKTAAKGALDSTIVAFLNKHPDQLIRVDGHTDGQPIKVSPWKDNYHLAAMRAHSVMSYLASKGVDRKRMHIAGFGENRPKAPPPADNPGKAIAANRRVEIFLIPAGGRTIEDIIEEVWE